MISDEVIFNTTCTVGHSTMTAFTAIFPASVLLKKAKRPNDPRLPSADPQPRLELGFRPSISTKSAEMVSKEGLVTHKWDGRPPRLDRASFDRVIGDI